MADDENKNIQFVLEVEKHPCLYNTTLSSYSRKNDTDKAWAEIGKIINMTGAACKEKWRNMRVVFMRHLKPLRSGSGIKKKKPYYLLDYMHFLAPYVKPVIPHEAGNLPSTSSRENTTTDVSNDVPTEFEQYTERSNVNEPSAPTTHYDSAHHSSNPKRKKSSLHETDKHFINYLKQKSTRINESQTSTDSVMSFLNSLAPELREMNLQQFKLFKRRVLNLIDDILNPTPPTPESAATSKSNTLNNETSYQTKYTPISQYGSPSYAQPVPTPNPLDFSGVSTQTPSTSTSEYNLVKQEGNQFNFH
ncbi:uncharacterized protein LOC125056957 [Pieris napi]|uniref:uncharacterized protein LOC125056957 n=1 Tax=Pieris napi TaxID=78633 RepID=UPI001FBB3A3A|nr:uncharacterized protein LOC125056957 [Pieris napi]